MGKEAFVVRTCLIKNLTPFSDYVKIKMYKIEFIRGDSMKKETLTVSGIKQDLLALIKSRLYIALEWRLAYVVLALLASMSFGIIFKRLWVGLLVFSVGVYNIIRFLIEYKKYLSSKKAIESASSRDDFLISEEKFSHTSRSFVYEPHLRRRFCQSWNVFIKNPEFLHLGGIAWRVPEIADLYKWSKEHYISIWGLKNIALENDVFLYVALKGKYDISFVYPCKQFVLDKALMKSDNE